LGSDPTNPTETVEQYAARITEALQHKDINDDPDPLLLEFGTTYFRESDKQLTGTISYTVQLDNTPEDKTATFTMADAGDFTRNHSWTILILYDGKLNVFNVVNLGIRKWDNKERDRNVYNW
jgi:hypothetical protein